MRRVIVFAASLAVAGCGGHGARFTPVVTNPWFPLKPGTTLEYAGSSEGEPQRDVFRVTHGTKVVDGVRCVVIDDRVYSRGRLIERTSDYYAQDTHGTVWYFGEDTAELDRRGRVVSREGTWHAGVGGGKAGVFMPANPTIGEAHLQEFLPGHAEDHFQVVSLTARVRVPYGSFQDVLRTREWTPLEPKVLDAKYYVRGIGEVYEGTVKGPPEVFRLVRVTRR